MGWAGQAIVSCSVLVDGHLSECRVLDEDPADRDFGKAALKLTEKFLMTPQTRNGQAVAGGTVRIPIRFIYPGVRLAPLQATHPKLREGHAELNCRVSKDLVLENCFLEALQPRDPVLRDTAIRLGTRFRAPMGTASGTRIVLPVDFRTGAAPAP